VCVYPGGISKREPGYRSDGNREYPQHQNNCAYVEPEWRNVRREPDRDRFDFGYSGESDTDASTERGSDSESDRYSETYRNARAYGWANSWPRVCGNTSCWEPNREPDWQYRCDAGRRHTGKLQHEHLCAILGSQRRNGGGRCSMICKLHK
jgi:hypothetical protein